MTSALAKIDGLYPLPYHVEVLSYLKEHEPDVWAWASSISVQEQHSNDVRERLLRDTYRLSRTSHAHAYELCQQVMERLQIDAPATLYQASGSEMNAALYFLPGEIHVVFQGTVLDRLQDNELLALLGHELAHYHLWSAYQGEFLVADRILNHSAMTQGGAPSYKETARLYGLHTELYADRGAAIAAQSATTAITTLVKIQTGIAEVDAEAYLEQARELDVKGDWLSLGSSHPESFLRTQAIDMWWCQAEQLDSWIAQRLRGPLRLTALDLLGQLALKNMTRGVIARFLRDPSLRSERVISQVQQFFPDWSYYYPPIDCTTLGSESVDASVSEYFHYVLLDLVLADEDLRDQGLLQAALMAAEQGSHEAFLKILKRELKLGKRELASLNKHLKGSLIA